LANIQIASASVNIAEMDTTDPRRGGYRFGAVGLFAVMHIAAFSVFFVHFRWGLAAWLVGTYVLRMFAVTGGYHRYFSHRSYQMSRVPQFIMAFLAQTSAQKGVLWWASHHRVHHRNSDKETDIHSPLHRGFWWSHVGWVISNDYDDYDEKLIGDFAKYPELRWLNKYHLIPVVCFGAAVLALGGLGAFLWGFVLSTVLLYHCSFSINSLAHLFGSRRFETNDGSRNNFWLAIITMGEGWHNNHHFSLSSARQGYRWWEVDLTYYVLKVLSWVRIVRGLRPFQVPAGFMTGQRATE
jgi:stearoyl-CoA desaturase (delta-9 desaturase)